MKKVVSTLLISGLLLTACSNDKDSDEETAQEMTTKEVTEAIHSLEEEAKKQEVVKSVEIEEGDKEVSVFLDFNDEISEQEQATFLFNYSLFLEELYPDKKIVYEEKE